MSEPNSESSPLLKLFSSIHLDEEPQPATTAPCHRRERELDRVAGTAAPKTRSVPFGTLVRLLADAMEDECGWLEDFANDTVQIDADLHEVMLAYQDLRQRKAA